MGNRLLRARALVFVIGLAMAGATGLAACKGMLPAQAPASPTAGGAAAPSASASLSGPASGPDSARAAHGHRLARIADEGVVTYSIQLRRCHSRAGGQLPDPRCTPGSVDPAVTQATIASTICRSGYTGKVRPPESETSHAKFDVAYPAYRIQDSAASELDHLISLELGGSNDITNLWPEVGTVPNPKDKVENALNRAVCDGRVSLAAAQRAIAADWMTAEARLGLH
jgi:hypothetical protein